MIKPAVWIAAIGVYVFGLNAFGADSAKAQSMTLTSGDIKEGATIVNEQVFKGFGCTGGNISPALSWSGAPGRHQELCGEHLRSGRPDRQRLVALGGVQHSARHHVIAQGRR